MSAHRGKADIPPQGRDFRFGPETDIAVVALKGNIAVLADLN